MVRNKANTSKAWSNCAPDFDFTFTPFEFEGGLDILQPIEPRANKASAVFEFSHFLAMAENALPRDKVQQIFDIFDQDDDGQLSLEELKHLAFLVGSAFNLNVRHC